MQLDTVVLAVNLLERLSSKSLLDIERQGYEIDKLINDMIDRKIYQKIIKLLRTTSDRAYGRILSRAGRNDPKI
jgi:hypothetical protein